MPKVRMLIGINGEDCTGWNPGEIHECSEQYAAYLIARRGAVLVDGELPPDEPAGLTTAKASTNRMARAPRTR